MQPWQNMVNILNEGFASATKWIEANKSVINVEKTKCMVVGSKYTLQMIPKLHLTFVNVIEPVGQVKIAGGNGRFQTIIDYSN